MKRKTAIVAGLAAVAVLAGTGAALAFAKKGPPPGVGSVTMQPSVTSGNPGVVVSFNGMVADAAGNGLAGVQVDFYVNGSKTTPVVYKDPSNGAPGYGPIGYYLLAYVFQSVGTYTVYTQAGGVRSPPATVTVSENAVNSFVIVAVTASGTCDIPFTGTQTQACSAAQSLVGKYEDSVFGGCYHEVVKSVSVYLGPNRVC